MQLIYQGPLNDERRRRIQDVSPDLDLIEISDKADVVKHIPAAEIVMGKISEEELEHARNLKWLHSFAAGPNFQLFPSFVEHPATFTSAAGNGAIPLAEHAMMLMLLLNRQAMRWLDNQKRHRWERFTHDELNGKTLGIIGLGNSGTDLAKKAKAFHMTTLGMRKSDRGPVDGLDELYTLDKLNDMLSRCDVVVVTAPLTPDTKGMLGEEQFKVMKPTAHFICFSRGGIADDDALLKALNEGWIGGAGLDAHSLEPLPEDSPFWTAPNTIVTPHNGATTQGTAERGFEIFLANLKRYMKGEPLMNIVDKAAGY